MTYFRNWGQRAVELERRRRSEDMQADVIAEGRARYRAWLAERDARPTRTPREWRTMHCRWCASAYRLPANPKARPVTERGTYKVIGFCSRSCASEYYCEEV